MTHTGLLKVILEKADAYKNEFHCECLCASHIAAAAADFCRSKYTGFECSEFSYPRFEEERLRYLFEKEIKLAAYFKLRLSKNTKPVSGRRALTCLPAKLLLQCERRVCCRRMLCFCAHWNSCTNLIDQLSELRTLPKRYWRFCRTQMKKSMTM